MALAICGLLLLAVGTVFGQTIRHGFVNYDDGPYVVENPQVTRGLSADGIAWAFTHSHASNWHPLTWISHMLDCRLYGLEPGGHHLTNVLLHAATAILLFLVLLEMTGEVWPSALTAAVFAVHPLRAESVAWVAERKDVLSGLLFVATLAAYAGYVRRPFSLARYLAVVVLYVLGLMAKPMLVTLPLVLLLLDGWPLGRLHGATTANGTWKRVILEKLPLLVVAAGSSIVTLLVQHEALVPSEQVALSWRIANAMVSYATYLTQFVCPAGLAVMVPHPANTLPAWKIAGALVGLAAISAGVVTARRKYPWLLLGWLWYLVMLIPVIGLVQVGKQAMADRYTYLPQIGLAIILAWAGGAVCRWRPDRRWACGAISALLVAVLMASAWRQTSYWQDSETLWTHTLSCTSSNPVAHNNLGAALNRQGRTDEAIAQYRQALEIRPDHVEAHNNLGNALAGRGRLDEAIAQYQKTLEINPEHVEAHNNLGVALAGRGRLDEAIAQYQKALEINPEHVEAHNNLGVALADRGRVAEAITEYQSALKIDPAHAGAHNNLGLALAAQGRTDDAVAQYRKALELKPDYAEARNNLGVVLRKRGELDEAMAEYRKALELKPGYTEAHNNLGNALAGRGRLADAMAHYRQALAINPDYAEAHQNLGAVLYQQGRTPEALAQWRQLLRLRPNQLAILNRLAWVLATAPEASLRNGPEAIELAQRAVRLSGGREPALLDTLAAAYAEVGRFRDATEVARQALALAVGPNHQVLADALRARIKLYQSGTPVRDVRQPASPRAAQP